MSKTMTVDELMDAMRKLAPEKSVSVRIIIDGVEHPVEDVWAEWPASAVERMTISLGRDAKKRRRSRISVDGPAT